VTTVSCPGSFHSIRTGDSGRVPRRLAKIGLTTLISPPDGAEAVVPEMGFFVKT